MRDYRLTLISICGENKEGDVMSVSADLRLFVSRVVCDSDNKNS